MFDSQVCTMSVFTIIFMLFHRGQRHADIQREMLEKFENGKKTSSPKAVLKWWFYACDRTAEEVHESL